MSVRGILRRTQSGFDEGSAAKERGLTGTTMRRGGSVGGGTPAGCLTSEGTANHPLRKGEGDACRGGWPRLQAGFLGRLRAAIGRPETASRDMSVDLSSRDVRVTEQLLHVAKIGAAVQQMGGERVP